MIIYTDWHGVDEDVVSINKYGGRWDYENWVGIIYRDLLDTFSDTLDFVASSNMKN